MTLNCEHVAELKYRPGKCSKKYRMVVVRKNISRTKGENALIDEIRYYYYITMRTDVSAAEIVRLANQRCDQENLIAQLKSGVDAMRAPTHELVSNWAYMVIATLAWNLKCWFALMMHLKADRRRYVAMEFRTFIREMILLSLPGHAPGAAAQRCRIIGWQPSVDRLVCCILGYACLICRFGSRGRPELFGPLVGQAWP